MEFIFTWKDESLYFQNSQKNIAQNTHNKGKLLDIIIG